jgi:hypothetical protein
MKDEAEYWYDGQDPVVCSAVEQVLFHLRLLANLDAQTIRQVVDKLFELLEATKNWPDVSNAADAVDHILIVHPTRPWQDLGLKLEDVLRLVTLHEARANRLGVAVKAFYVAQSQPAQRGYSEWLKILRGRRTGGKRSGKGKREEHVQRDERMRAEAVRRLKGGDDRVKIMEDLAERHGIGCDRVRQILSAHPEWPSPRKRGKRNHT